LAKSLNLRLLVTVALSLIPGAVVMIVLGARDAVSFVIDASQ